MDSTVRVLVGSVCTAFAQLGLTSIATAQWPVSDDNMNYYAKSMSRAGVGFTSLCQIIENFARHFFLRYVGGVQKSRTLTCYAIKSLNRIAHSYGILL